MKKSNLIYSTMILLAAFVMATAVSCKKDDDSPASKTDLITGKNLVVTAMTVSPGIEFNGVVYTDFFAQMPACSKDDVTVFNTDGTATFDEGATKCDAGDPQTTSGTWEFQDNETKLSVTSEGETDVFDIIELTSSKLKVSYDVVDDYGNGEETYTFTVTFNAN